MEWILGGVLCLTLLLLVYSVISTSQAMRKKVQPSLDSIFETLHIAVFGSRDRAKRGPGDRPRSE